MNAVFIEGSIQKIYNYIKQSGEYELINELFDIVIGDKEFLKEKRDNLTRKFIISNDELSGNNPRALDFYLQQHPDLPEKETILIKGIKEFCLEAIFEIKSLSEKTVELYSLMNEKTYQAHVLDSVSKENSIVEGNYIDAIIIQFEDKYYVIEVLTDYSSDHDAYQEASRLLHSFPLKLYEDNDKKITEIKEITNKIYTEFKKAFGAEIIYTTNEHSDTFISSFIEYVKTGNKIQIKDLYKYIVDSSYFCKESEVDDDENDVAIFVDPDEGIYLAKYYLYLDYLLNDKEDELSQENHEVIVYCYIIEPKEFPVRACLNLYNRSKDQKRFFQLSKEAFKSVGFDVEPGFETFEDVLLDYKDYLPNDRLFSPYIYPLISETIRTYNKLAEIQQLLLEEKRKNDVMIKYCEPVNKLLEYGKPPSSKKWRNYLNIGLSEKDIPLLIEMTNDDDLHLAEDDSHMWAPVHAWRALGQLKAKEAIIPLIDLFTELENDDWAGDDLPVVIGMIGEDAIDPLKNVLYDQSITESAKISAVCSLAEIGKNVPSSKEDCVDIFLNFLNESTINEDTINGFIMLSLIDLEATNTIDSIRSAFAKGVVDSTVVGDLEDVERRMGFKPSTARQQNVPIRRKQKKIGRNEPCPCGSGKKYKKCCLK